MSWAVVGWLSRVMSPNSLASGTRRSSCRRPRVPAYDAEERVWSCPPQRPVGISGHGLSDLEGAFMPAHLEAHGVIALVEYRALAERATVAAFGVSRNRLEPVALSHSNPLTKNPIIRLVEAAVPHAPKTSYTPFRVEGLLERLGCV